jgi:hypothetical protein
MADVAAAARATYVAPGEQDEFYLFYSGGHSGQVYVAGVPSMRHIATIPVFAPYPATGYGFERYPKSGCRRATRVGGHGRRKKCPPTPTFPAERGG